MAGWGECICARNLKVHISHILSFLILNIQLLNELILKCQCPFGSIGQNVYELSLYLMYSTIWLTNYNHIKFTQQLDCIG